VRFARPAPLAGLLFYFEALAKILDSRYAFCMEFEKLLSYTVIFEPAVEGGFVVSVPVLPGCLTQGETFEEARRNIKDAIAVYLATLKDLGEDIPRELSEPIVTRVVAPDPA
jgi:antitoxin HicB